MTIAKLQALAEYMDGRAKAARVSARKNRAWREKSRSRQAKAVARAWETAALKVRELIDGGGQHHPAPFHRL